MYIIGVHFLILKVILSVRMCWLLPGIGFTWPTLRHLNQRTFLMMIHLISLSSLTLEEEGFVILHLR